MNFLTSFKGFLLCILLVSMILNSCDKEIEVDLGSSKGQIVVEGSIQQEYPAYVFLTKSEKSTHPTRAARFKDFSTSRMFFSVNKLRSIPFLAG